MDNKIEREILSMGYRERATGVYMKPVAFALLTIEVKEDILITLWFKASNTSVTNDLVKNGMSIWDSEKLKWKNCKHGGLAPQIKEFEWKHLFRTGNWDSEFNFLTIYQELNYI